MLSAIFRNRTTTGPTELRGQASTWGTWIGDDTNEVSESSALRLLAVTGSVQLLTESISTLPVDVFRYTGERRVEVTPPAWLRMPTVGLTFTDWCSQVMTSLLLHGNAYLVVLRDAGGRVVEVQPVPPQDVVVRRENGNMAGRKQYVVKGVPFTGEMLHIKGMMLPGSDVGLSPLDFAVKSIKLGLSAQQYGLESFEDDLNMPGVIEFPGSVDPEKMREIAQLWRRSRRKGGRGLPGVLEGGGTWKATSITNEAAQYLETRQWTAAEICAQVYLVDPRELGIPLTGSTLEYVNASARMSNLVRKGLLRWIVRIEAAVSSLLPQPQYMKFNVDGLLRGDPSERWDTYLKASQINATAATTGQAPVLLTDEMRAWEELDPIAADQVPVVPDVAEVVPSMNAAGDELAELRSMLMASVAGREPAPINVSVDARQEPPVVNVENRMGEVVPPAVTVNVEPTPVTIDNTVNVDPTPVNVTSTPMVNVEVPRVRHMVHRDAQGNIVEVSEEPVD